jgi:hypothetical protein
MLAVTAVEASLAVRPLLLSQPWMRDGRREDFATNLLLSLDNMSSSDEFLVCCCVCNQHHVDIDGFAVALSTALLRSVF